ncbi:MAG: serine/threonine protein kinase [Gammaproteobacteria bacterium]|jgi:serine/threonine protein kinase
MTSFPEPPSDEYDIVYLENTDKELPIKLNQNMRYAYFKTIARGGKAIVQSCKDLHLSRTICYKILRPEFANNPIEQKRFLREARVSALLQHPNTVPTYELGRNSKGDYYFTMKLVYGYTLREIMDYRERYDLKQLVNVIVQIANALEYAHGHRVIHRDIKPENILVGPFGEVLLLDWGLAKVWNPDGTSPETQEDPEIDLNMKVSSMTDHEKLQGTITYMSPEQIERDPNINFKTDIYSLGVVLYEILAGRPPTTGETFDEIIQQTMNEEPERPSDLTTANVPTLLEDAAMHCITKNVDNRMASCAELVRLLEEDWL